MSENTDFEHAENTVTFDAWRIDEAEAIIAKANRRLEREGISERFTYTTELHESEREVNATEIRFGAVPGAIIDTSQITLTLSAPHIEHAGWTFLAACDRTPETGTMVVRCAPGTDLAGWRPEPGLCDHCGLVRRRNTTYIVGGDDSDELLQVGSTCMEAFLGIKPRGLWSLSFDLSDLTDTDEEAWAGSLKSRQCLDLRSFIADTLAVSDRGRSFVSRSAAQWGDRSASVDLIDPVLYPVRVRDSRARAERDEARALAEECLSDGTVDEVLSAARAIEGDGDYPTNLRAVLEGQVIDIKHRGIAASAVSVWMRGKVKQAEDEADARKIAAMPAGHFGEIKERVRGVPATVTNVYGYSTYYGGVERPTTIVSFSTDEGYALCWKASKDVDVTVGDRVKLTATVKVHSEYRGAPQTDITRAVIEEG